MTITALEKSYSRAGSTNRRMSLTGDRSGHWTLSGFGTPDRQFDDFDSARHASGTEAATIDVWQDNDYICCLAPEQQDDEAPADVAPPRDQALATTEKYANRAAQILMPIAGAFFWLALMVLALAASLGWRLVLL